MKTPDQNLLKSTSSWGYLLHDVARLLKRRFEDEARRYGLTLAQWKTLGRIGVGGDISQVALAGAVDTDPMTMSGILDRLEKRGLISRYPDPNDSRAKLATVTPEGASLVESARDVGRGVLEGALKDLGPRDREAFIRSLGCIRDNLLGETARIRELQQ